jgi:hypothetical protein
MKTNRIFKIVMIGVVLVLLGVFINSYLRVKDTRDLTPAEYSVKNK